MDTESIQKFLIDHDLDGWLMADFHARNTIAMDMLKVTGMVSRRSFFFVPAKGAPTGLVHAIERDKFEHIGERLISFSGYKQLELDLTALLRGCKRVAMEYSAGGRLPYIGLVDAGTIELVREMDIEVVSSADLVAGFGARLTPEQLETHRVAAKHVVEIKSLAHEYIRKSLTDGPSITEYEVVEFIMDQFRQRDMTTDYAPNCSVDANAGNPHYEPSREDSQVIKKGQLVLIDLWGRLKAPRSIYADITWMAFAGAKHEIPQKYQDAFAVLAEARDTAVAYIDDHLKAGPVYGSQVDDVCRKVITDAGLGELFVHRTGHSIATEVHGPGPNIDNLETEDRRMLQPGHCFSIEPGVYTNEWGMRTEIDGFITADGCEVATLPLQREIVALL